MTTAPYVGTNFTAQDATTYKTNIDNDFLMLTRPNSFFMPSAQSTPNMTMQVAGGAFVNSVSGIVALAAQNTPTITAPVSNPRIDLVHIDMLTGVIGVVTGTEAASPATPALPAGKWPVATISLSVGVTAITNSMITDYRMYPSPGLGTAAGYNVGSGANKIPVQDGSGNAAILNQLTAAILYANTQVYWGAGVGILQYDASNIYIETTYATGDIVFRNNSSNEIGRFHQGTCTLTNPSGGNTLSMVEGNTPAVGAAVGQWQVLANNSSAVQKTFGLIGAVADNVTSGSEASHLIFQTAFGQSTYIGQGLYGNTATGGDKGIGSGNFTAVYINGTALSANPAPGANTVGQGQLKTATGSVSVAASASAVLALPGGSYGFFPQFKASATSGITTSAIMGNAYFDNVLNTPGGTTITVYRLDNATLIGTTYVTNITLGGLGVGTSFAQQLYVTASPPYDLGDGECRGFWYLLVDRSGKVRAQYVAYDPPWAYNGPTDIRPHHVCPRTGKSYRRRRRMPVSMADVLSGQATIADYLAARSAWADTAAARREAMRRAVSDAEAGFLAAQRLTDELHPGIDRARAALRAAELAHGARVAEIECRAAAMQGWAKEVIEPFEEAAHEEAVASALQAHAAAQADAARLMQALWDARTSSEMDPAFDWVEIDHALKNADMPLIPHPFMGNRDLDGTTILLLDPMHELIGTLIDEMQEGHDIHELVHRGHLRFDNEALSRQGPAGVMQVRLRL